MNGPLNTTVMWLTFRQLFTRKRFIFTGIFAMVPLVIVLFFKATRHDNDPTGEAFLVKLYSDIVAFVLLPLSAVVFGTAAFGGEIDDGTIVYLLVKDLPRWTVVLSKWVVAMISTAIMMTVAVILPWLALGMQADSTVLVEAFVVAVAVGAGLYCAIFTTLGLVSKRALVIGLIYIVVLEISLSPGVQGLKSLSVREFVMTVAKKLASGSAGMGGSMVPVNTVWTMSGVFLVVALGLGIRWLSRYEMAERV